MTVLIEGKEYYPIQDFAEKTFRSISAIRHLMFDGNKLRKLKYVEDRPGKYYIPLEELTSFPFTCSGRFASNSVYHYNTEGQYIRYTDEEVDQLYKEAGITKRPTKALVGIRHKEDQRAILEDILNDVQSAEVL